jgi:hypothetical protein
MIEKGVIQVEGMTRCGRGYGRTYAATMTNMEYAKSLLEESTPELTPDERILGLLPLLLQDEIQPQTRTAVKKMLDKR